MIKHTIKRPFFIKVYMDFFKYRGLATIWNVIYYNNNESLLNQKLVKHELKHIEQMKNEGKVLWLIKYYYFWFRYGYQNNPYEIEARKAER